MEIFLGALSQAFTFEGIIAVALGVLAGIILGALPGISTNMAITLLFPFAYVVEGVPGINMLLGVYCGSIYGGSISAILLNTPGTPCTAILWLMTLVSLAVHWACPPLLPLLVA